MYLILADNAAEIFKFGHLYRLFTSLLPSSGFAEGALTWLLLYRFRVLERLMGTGKFAAFSLLCFGYAVGTRFLTLLVSPSFGVPSSYLASPATGGLASGPYELLFALLFLYFRFVPTAQPKYVSLFGGRVHLSDKAPTYLLALQLCLSGGLRSLCPALGGLVFGVLATGVGLLERVRMPRPVAACFRRLVAPWWESGNPQASDERAALARQRRLQEQEAQERRELEQAMRQFAGGAHLPQGVFGQPMPQGAGTDFLPPGMGGLGMGGGPGMGARGAAVPADPEAVERLMQLGTFDRADVERALSECYNDENAAANRLLGM